MIDFAFIWESESWKQAHRQDYGAFLDRHYQTSHFIHTWADLIGMRFEGFDPSKSLVNKAFKERPLLVGDPGSPKGLIDMRTMLASPPPQRTVPKTADGRS